MLNLLKFSLVIGSLGAFVACTPIPPPQLKHLEPRPIPPLPSEKLTLKATAPSPIGKTKPSPSTKPTSTAGKPAALSANEVKVRLQQAEDKAISAASLRQSAQTQEDWKLVINQLQQAIALLKQIPLASPQKAVVQKRLAEYQGNLAQVRQLATAPPTATQPAYQPKPGGGPLMILPDASPAPTSSPTPSPTPKNSPTPTPEK